MNVYLLSIREENITPILSGNKQWEFRRNPRFGINPDWSLQLGDVIFLMGHTHEDEPGSIRCMVEVESILREEDFWTDFESDPKRLAETGRTFANKQERDAYMQHLRADYSVGIKLKPYRVTPSIATDNITHRTTGQVWKGIGFMQASVLKRYTADGRELERALREVAQALIPEVNDSISRD